MSAHCRFVSVETRTRSRDRIQAVRVADVLVIIGCRWQFEPLIADAIKSTIMRPRNPVRRIEVTAGGNESFPTLLTGGARAGILSGQMAKAIDKCVGP